MKKTILITMLLIIAMTSIVMANPITNLKFQIDGIPLDIPESYGTPFIDSASRTQIGVRFFSETLGHKIDWNSQTWTVTVDDEISIKIGDYKIYTSNGVVEIDSPAVLINGRTFLPLRFISEILGYEISYEGPKNSNNFHHTVNIITNNKENSTTQINEGYIDFGKDLRKDKVLEDFLKSKYGDSYTIYTNFTEIENPGPMSSILLIKSEFEGSDVWKLVVKKHNGNQETIEFLVKHIFGESAGSNIWNWLQDDDTSDANQWVKMSDNVEIYFDTDSATSGAVFYIKNI